MVQQINVRELERKLTSMEPVYLIDVRQPWERELGALPNSLFIPLGELATRGSEIKPPAGALVVAYCHHGIRSLHAAAILEQLGFTPAASLQGGIEAWSLQIDANVPRYG